MDTSAPPSSLSAAASSGADEAQARMASAAGAGARRGKRLGRGRLSDELLDPEVLAGLPPPPFRPGAGEPQLLVAQALVHDPASVARAIEEISGATITSGEQRVVSVRARESLAKTAERAIKAGESPGSDELEALILREASRDLEADPLSESPCQQVARNRGLRALMAIHASRKQAARKPRELTVPQRGPEAAPPAGDP